MHGFTCFVCKGIGTTMADDRRDTGSVPAAVAGVDVHGLAREAIRLLAVQGSERPDPLQARLDYLCAAFLSEEEEMRHAAIQKLRQDGVSIPDIVDHVIPEIARVYGQWWADDELSFAEVSIGSARLQECVRSLVARDISGSLVGLTAAQSKARTRSLPPVLLIIPRSEDHTLGTFVAADQFRRFGYDVDIAIDSNIGQLTRKLWTRRYVLVGITIGGRRTLASTKELVEKIKATVTRVTPVVVGGSFVSFDKNLKQSTGADHVAVSVKDALTKCGLDIAGADPSEKTVPAHEE